MSLVDDVLADFVDGLENLTPLDFPTGRKPGFFFFVVLARGTSGATGIGLDIVVMGFILGSIQIASGFHRIYDLSGASRHVGWPAYLHVLNWRQRLCFARTERAPVDRLRVTISLSDLVQSS